MLSKRRRLRESLRQYLTQDPEGSFLLGICKGFERGKKGYQRDCKERIREGARKGEERGCTRGDLGTSWLIN